MKHTPTPWHHKRSLVDREEGLPKWRASEILSTTKFKEGGSVTSQICAMNDADDAEFIVTACNAHEELVHMLQVCIAKLEGRNDEDTTEDVVRFSKEALAKAGVKP